MPDAHFDPAAEDLIETAVAALLHRVPARWEEYDADSLTATESKALFLLVAAGMVERRIRFRLRLHNHPVAIEATVTATGEYGLAKAMESVLASVWSDWKDAFQAWRAGETRGAPATVTEHLKPDEWRLTDQGVLARVDLDGGHARTALDFVLRRGFFDGGQRLILDASGPRIARRGPDPGTGQLVTMRNVQADAATPGTINIGNWDEGAAAFVSAYEAVSKAKRDGNGNGAPCDGAPTGPPSAAVAKVSDDGAGGPEPDPYDTRKAVWFGKRIYLGNEGQVSRLFWLLAKPRGAARSLADVQRAIDGMETDAQHVAMTDEVRKAGQRVRKAISKLRAAIREAELDDHVLIVRGGTHAEPEYSMVWRFAR